MTIVPASREHLAALAEIELAAARLFPLEELPLHLRDQTLEVEDLAHAQREGLLWVALDESGAPIGFAVAEALDDCWHLDELDVHPDHGRRGIGRALVETVLTAARAAGSPAVTLTTFRDLPWNEPFYRSRGFEELADDELGPELRATFEEEIAAGLPRARRIVMRRDLAGSSG